MAKQPPIRIRKKDRRERNRLAKNTRSKIRYVQQQYGVDLSNDVTLPKMEDFETRKEFNRWKREQQQFTNRKNPNYQFVKNQHGVVASEQQLKDVERNNKQERKLAQEKIDSQREKPFIVRGKEEGKLKDREKLFSDPVNIYGVSMPEKFEFEDMQTQQRFKDVEERAERRSDESYYEEKEDRLLDNFISMLSDSFNSDADDLIEMVQEIPKEDFFEMFNQFEEFNFNDYYPPDGDVDGNTDEHLDDINAMMNYIEAYRNGEVDMDYKGF